MFLRPDYQTCGSLQHFASFPSAADDTENHHSGTPPLQFLGKDKSGVVLQLRLLWQHRGHLLEGRIRQFARLCYLQCLIISGKQ